MQISDCVHNMKLEFRLNTIVKFLSTMLYVFFWVIPRRLNFICRRFGTLCLFHLHRQVGIYLLAYDDGTYRVFRNVGI